MNLLKKSRRGAFSYHMSANAWCFSEVGASFFPYSEDKDAFHTSERRCLLTNTILKSENMKFFNTIFIKPDKVAVFFDQSTPLLGFGNGDLFNENSYLLEFTESLEGVGNIFDYDGDVFLVITPESISDLALPLYALERGSDTWEYRGDWRGESVGSPGWLKAGYSTKNASVPLEK